MPKPRYKVDEYATRSVRLWFDNDEQLYNEKQKLLNFMRQRNAKTLRWGKNFKPKALSTGIRDILGRRGFDRKTPDMKTAKEMNFVDWGKIAEDWSEEI